MSTRTSQMMHEGMKRSGASAFVYACEQGQPSIRLFAALVNLHTDWKAGP